MHWFQPAHSVMRICASGSQGAKMFGGSAVCALAAHRNVLDKGDVLPILSSAQL